MKWTTKEKVVAAAVVALPIIVVLILMHRLLQVPGPATWAKGDLRIVVEHNANGVATGEFKFQKVPAPSSTDAATEAKFLMVTGQEYRNGAGLDKLHDGGLPKWEDEPAENFFFSDGSDGGRIGIDLNQAIDLQQINTYSWHPNTRGPQVYKLYASDGTSSRFQAAPDDLTDPAKAGWKLLANVDTRPAQGDEGGQYGVSITSAGGKIGHYRYLLFDCKPTEKNDRWGNTFYSEIDVVAK